MANPDMIASGRSYDRPSLVIRGMFDSDRNGRITIRQMNDEH